MRITIALDEQDDIVCQDTSGTDIIVLRQTGRPDRIYLNQKDAEQLVVALDLWLTEHGR